MKYRSSFIVLLLAPVLLCGCDPGGDIPPAEAFYIVGGSDGINRGWFAYADAEFNVIDRRGLQMNIQGGENGTYMTSNGMGGMESHPTDCQHIEYNGVTQAGGWVYTHGVREDWDDPMYSNVISCIQIAYPNGSQGSEVATFSYGTSSRDEAQIERTNVVLPRGGEIDEDPMAAVRGINSFVSPNLANMTITENEAILGLTVNPPTNGIEVVACHLVNQNGDMGNGYSTVANNVYPVNLTDPNDYMRYAGPYRYSWIVKTANPLPLSGLIGLATIKTMAAPTGIEVGVYVDASNADMQTHVIRTDLFLPVDSSIGISALPEIEVYDCFTPSPYEPNIWDSRQFEITRRIDWLDFVDPNLYADPNIIPDPNVLFDPTNADFFTFDNRLDTTCPNFDQILIPERVMTLPVIAIDPINDNMTVQFNPQSAEFLINCVDFWLSDEETVDLNGDGIVNMLDWFNSAPMTRAVTAPASLIPIAPVSTSFAISEIKIKEETASVPIETYIEVLRCITELDDGENPDGVFLMRMEIINNMLKQLRVEK